MLAVVNGFPLALPTGFSTTGEPRVSRLHLHLVSDSTGETLETVAKAALAQFDDVEPIRHYWPMVRTPGHVERIMGEIAQNPGLVLFTIVNAGNRHVSVC